jgi:hypothetical protein
MPYVKGTFTGERARQIARVGRLSSRGAWSQPWWPEEICEKVEKIIWRVYCLGELGEDWHEFTAYDGHGKVLGVHRKEEF